MDTFDISNKQKTFSWLNRSKEENIRIVCKIMMKFKPNLPASFASCIRGSVRERKIEITF